MVEKWVAEIWHEGTPVRIAASDIHIATQAAQWGADQELEACCEWVSKHLPYLGDFPMPEDKLRNARRPKPPSLKEQALEQLDEISNDFRVSHGGIITCDKIRKALEALPND
jgi:hypothetical protein